MFVYRLTNQIYTYRLVYYKCVRAYGKVVVAYKSFGERWDRQNRNKKKYNDILRIKTSKRPISKYVGVSVVTWPLFYVPPSFRITSVRFPGRYHRTRIRNEGHSEISPGNPTIGPKRKATRVLPGWRRNRKRIVRRRTGTIRKY